LTREGSAREICQDPLLRFSNENRRASAVSLGKLLILQGAAGQNRRNRRFL